MRNPSAGFVMVAFAAFVAPGQAPAQQSMDRVLYYARSDTEQNAQEIATIIRAIADIEEASADKSNGSLKVHGTAEQISLAEWLFGQLDQPVTGQVSAAPQEYKLQSGRENMVRILYAPDVKAMRDFQEIATVVRSIGDIRRVFTCSASRAVVVRGTAEQVGMAEWLSNDLDKAMTRPLDHSITPEFQMPDSYGESIVRAFHFANAASDQDFLEMATAIRIVLNIRRLFTCNTTRVMAARSTSDQMLMVEWLFNQLDRPASQGAGTAVRQYRVPGKSDDSLRVFYLSRNRSVADFQRIAEQVRTGQHPHFVYIQRAESDRHAGHSGSDLDGRTDDSRSRCG